EGANEADPMRLETRCPGVLDRLDRLERDGGLPAALDEDVRRLDPGRALGRRVVHRAGPGLALRVARLAQGDPGRLRVRRAEPAEELVSVDSEEALLPRDAVDAEAAGCTGGHRIEGFVGERIGEESLHEDVGHRA